jgi:hypothetical protein
VLAALADGRASADGSALPLNADAAAPAGTVKAGQSVHHALGAGRVAYPRRPSTGALTVNGVTVNTRDGVTVSGEASIEITATADAEVVLVDVTG